VSLRAARARTPPSTRPSPAHAAPAARHDAARRASTAASGVLQPVPHFSWWWRYLGARAARSMSASAT